VHGFKDPTQGTLFFDIKRILKVKRPKAFFLENVKHLMRHDKGQTFKVITDTLNELEYTWNFAIVDAANWIPQHRERIFIVGYNPKIINITKEHIRIPLKPTATYSRPTLKSIIEKVVEERYTLGPGTWATLERHKEHHAQVGNGFGYGLIPWPIPTDTVTRTISARYHKDGAEILIEQKGARPRRLTVAEAQQLQGFDKKRFRFPVSDTQAYRQIGNSVPLPAIEAVAKEISFILSK
jgi:DNA (cytosine-5)-methyltransferase 1